MAENWQEALASLRVLVCIARADGVVQPSEQTVLAEALQQLGPTPENLTLSQLLTENLPLMPLLQQITTPAAQQAVYHAARSLAEQDGIHPEQQRLLAQIRSTFESALSADAAGVTAAGVTADTDAEPSPYESLVAGIQVVSQHNRRARDLILDYALGAAVIGLIPISIPGFWLMQILALIILLVKMRRDIAALWGFPKGHGFLAFAGSWFGSLGALSISLMAGLTLLGIGAFMPLVEGLALAAAFATLTWAMGQVTNQFHFSSGRMDQIAFQQMLERSAQSRQHRSRQPRLRQRRRRSDDG